MISYDIKCSCDNFRIFYQILFQFWKGICFLSKNIFHNLVRDGCRPQFHYHCEGFCRTHLFQHVVCGNQFLSFRRVVLKGFFLLSLGPSKRITVLLLSDKSLVYVSTEASGSMNFFSSDATT